MCKHGEQLVGPHWLRARSRGRNRYLSRRIDTLIRKRSLGATRTDNLPGFPDADEHPGADACEVTDGSEQGWIALRVPTDQKLVPRRVPDRAVYRGS
jgi:hypothetical protein